MVTVISLTHTFIRGGSYHFDRLTTTGAPPAAKRIRILPLKSICMLASNVPNEAAGWVPQPVRTTWRKILILPGLETKPLSQARSKSLYRLRLPAHTKLISSLNSKRYWPSGIMINRKNSHAPHSQRCTGRWEPAISLNLSIYTHTRRAVAFHAGNDPESLA
jgi:hypothetical protein